MKAQETYVMDVTEEAGRLERQAAIGAYDVEKEFGSLTIPHGSRVLDAGCGTGIVARFLAQKWPQAKIEGCDLSAERLSVAESQPGGNDVFFFQGSLTSIPRQDSYYDFIVSRYVIEHLADPLSALQDLHRVLKPGGIARIADLDGLIVNMAPQSPELSALLNEALSKLPINLCVGRRLPALMADAGFTSIEWTVEVHAFQGFDLEREKQNVIERFIGAREGLRVALGSDLKSKRLENLVVQELNHPHLVLFYNKFVVEGKKEEER